MLLVYLILVVNLFVFVGGKNQECYDRNDEASFPTPFASQGV